MKKSNDFFASKISDLFVDYDRLGHIPVSHGVDVIAEKLNHISGVTDILNELQSMDTTKLSFVSGGTRKSIMQKLEIYKTKLMYNNKPRIFVDMDGTLAKFQYVDTIETLYEYGYFRNLEPQKNVVDAVRKLIADDSVEVYVLSAYLGDSRFALAEKKEWLHEHLPELDMAHQVFVPCGDSKEKYVARLQPIDLLVDDYTHNLRLWDPPAKGIKVMNGINGTRGTWSGARTNIECSSTRIMSDIKNALKDRLAELDRIGISKSGQHQYSFEIDIQDEPEFD